MVKVAALIKSIERVAWKGGTHETVEHHVDAEGNHTIVVRVPNALADGRPRRSSAARRTSASTRS